MAEVTQADSAEYFRKHADELRRHTRSYSGHFQTLYLYEQMAVVSDGIACILEKLEKEAGRG